VESPKLKKQLEVRLGRTFVFILENKPLKCIKFYRSNGKSGSSYLDSRHTGSSVLKSLVDFVGGHSYLMQLAFYWLQSGSLSLTQILNRASTNQGIYGEYLRRLWSALQREEALGEAFYRVLVNTGPVALSPKQAYALADMGLVNLMGHQVELRCELYRAYFCPLLELECG
jgi:hypothetical protein